MARMYPNQLSPDTASDAERRLYAAFRDELDNRYTVFHSVAWQSLDPDGRPRDGEADFVIAHPRRGIPVMEAKGGAIRCDPRTGRWTCTAHFKGLERAVIILAEIDRLPDQWGELNQLLYFEETEIPRMFRLRARWLDMARWLDG